MLDKTEYYITSCEHDCLSTSMYKNLDDIIATEHYLTCGELIRHCPKLGQQRHVRIYKYKAVLDTSNSPSALLNLAFKPEI